MTTGIQSPSPVTIDQTQLNELAFAATQAVEALFYAYDPTESLDDAVIETMIWNVENTLIDFTYEIEELAEVAVNGFEEDSMPTHPLAPVAEDAVTEDVALDA